MAQLFDANGHRNPAINHADWEDLLVRALLKERGIDLSSYPDIKLSGTGFRGRSDDDSENITLQFSKDGRSQLVVNLNGSRFDSL